MPVVTNILFAKAWGKKQVAKYWGGGYSPSAPLVPTPMIITQSIQKGTQRGMANLSEQTYLYEQRDAQPMCLSVLTKIVAY